MFKGSLWRRFQGRMLEKSARENFDGIEYVAKSLRESKVVNWDAYAANSGCREMGFDPAFHYVLAGERAGYAAKEFDAKFYASRYSDAASNGVNKLYHYLNHGQRDGRYITRSQLHHPIPIIPTDVNRPTIFVVVHEASRTGAPILGLNLIEHLTQKYFVVAIVFKGGDLMEAFEAAADVAIVCPKIKRDRTPLIDKVVAAYRPIFAVVNSLECGPLADDLVSHGIPYVTLVQEFCCLYGTDSLRQLFAGSASIIFASKVIMDSSLESYPFVERDRCFLQPQGRSVIPPITKQEMQRKSASGKKDDIRAVLRPTGAPRRFIVAGLGTVDMRKGVDIFIATATSVIRTRPDLDILFVWIGHRSKNEDDAQFLLFVDQQIKRAECGDRIVFLPPTADLETVYEEIDVLFLSSRLDPMPNVCIDAAIAKTPVVCFQNGTGFAELLAMSDDLKTLVVPYLDVAAAARLIQTLADDGAKTAAFGLNIEHMARTMFDMSKYVALIEDRGHQAAAAAGADLARVDGR